MDASDDTSVASSYAWWLTGDEQAAAAAVQAAVGSPAVRAAAGHQRLAALLAEVRRTAAPAPTMCPASEIALLHDAHGVSLDDAAGLAAVDAADARTELAHGRLEALLETVIEPFVHPERLGGLAIGNPADVAHARQCESCASTRDLLERGRRELRALAGTPVAGGPVEPAGPTLPGGHRRVAVSLLVAGALVVLVVIVVLALTG